MPDCKYGDPTCPCQDGDACHYEGAKPMNVPPEYVRATIAALKQRVRELDALLMTQADKTFAEQQARLAAEREAAALREAQFSCAAKNSHPDLQDCDWPFCGCDPHAEKVLAAIDECDMIIVLAEERDTLAAQVEGFRDKLGDALTDLIRLQQVINGVRAKDDPEAVRIAGMVGALGGVTVKASPSPVSALIEAGRLAVRLVERTNTGDYAPDAYEEWEDLCKACAAIIVKEEVDE